jgi:hypothetical protein
LQEALPLKITGKIILEEDTVCPEGLNLSQKVIQGRDLMLEVIVPVVKIFVFNK